MAVDVNEVVKKALGSKVVTDERAILNIEMSQGRKFVCHSVYKLGRENYGAKLIELNTMDVYNVDYETFEALVYAFKVANVIAVRQNNNSNRTLTGLNGEPLEIVQFYKGDANRSLPKVMRAENLKEIQHWSDKIALTKLNVRRVCEEYAWMIGRGESNLIDIATRVFNSNKNELMFIMSAVVPSILSDVRAKESNIREVKKNRINEGEGRMSVMNTKSPFQVMGNTVIVEMTRFYRLNRVFRFNNKIVGAEIERNGYTCKIDEKSMFKMLDNFMFDNAYNPTNAGRISFYFDDTRYEDVIIENVTKFNDEAKHVVACEMADDMVITEDKIDATMLKVMEGMVLNMTALPKAKIASNMFGLNLKDFNALLEKLGITKENLQVKYDNNCKTRRKYNVTKSATEEEIKNMPVKIEVNGVVVQDYKKEDIAEEVVTEPVETVENIEVNEEKTVDVRIENAKDFAKSVIEKLASMKPSEEDLNDFEEHILAGVKEIRLNNEKKAEMLRRKADILAELAKINAELGE